MIQKEHLQFLQSLEINLGRYAIGLTLKLGTVGLGLVEETAVFEYKLVVNQRAILITTHTTQTCTVASEGTFGNLNPSAIGHTSPLVFEVNLAAAVAGCGVEALQERVCATIPSVGFGTAERCNQMPLALLVSEVACVNSATFAIGGD